MRAMLHLRSMFHMRAICYIYGQCYICGDVTYTINVTYVDFLLLLFFEDNGIVFFSLLRWLETENLKTLITDNFSPKVTKLWQ